jgi:hypothetical protein
VRAILATSAPGLDLKPGPLSGPPRRQFWMQFVEQWQKAWADTMAFWGRAGKATDGVGSRRGFLLRHCSDRLVTARSPAGSAVATKKRRAIKKNDCEGRAGCSITPAPHGRVIIAAHFRVGKFPGMHVGPDLLVLEDGKGARRRSDYDRHSAREMSRSALLRLVPTSRLFYRFGNDFLHIFLVIKFDLSPLQSDFLNAILALPQPVGHQGAYRLSRYINSKSNRQLDQIGKVKCLAVYGVFVIHANIIAQVNRKANVQIAIPGLDL